VLNWLRSLFTRKTPPAPATPAAAVATPEAAVAALGPRGVDVASFQGPPAQWRSAAGNISWAAVKLTELGPGSNRYVNPDAAADWAYLRQNGKGRIAYLFGHPSASVATTVSFFAAEARKLGLADQDGIALDLEVTDGLTAAQVARWAVSVQEGLFHELHRMPVLYTFLSFAQSGNCAGLGHYPLWIADPSRTEGRPQVPSPWKTWTIHQYSQSNNLDRDVANYASRTAMFDALGKPGGPHMQNLGGSLTGALSTARWPDGVTVVAGLGTNGLIQTARWQAGKWGGWKNASTIKAKGSPGLVAFNAGAGQLYFTEESGAVIQLTTDNTGQTWT
jgi:lysozyme